MTWHINTVTVTLLRSDMTVVACYHSYCVDLSQLLQLITFSYPPLLSDRRHPNYDDCLEVNSEYYQNFSVRDCVTQCSQSAAHLYEQFLQVQ